MSARVSIHTSMHTSMHAFMGACLCGLSVRPVQTRVHRLDRILAAPPGSSNRVGTQQPCARHVSAMRQACARHVSAMRQACARHVLVQWLWGMYWTWGHVLDPWLRPCIGPMAGACQWHYCTEGAGIPGGIVYRDQPCHRRSSTLPGHMSLFFFHD